jgi:thiamine-monophosphate kinase
MPVERDFIARHLAPLAPTAAARGLADDAAVWVPPLGRDLVFTHDVLAAGVHFLADDPPGDIAWKLLAVNLSDLAAMGAVPAGVLLGLGLSASEDDGWRTAFTQGLGRALAHFGVALWGGDTVTGLAAAVIGLTAVGHVEPGTALGRATAGPGDDVWVSGTIGDAGLGLQVARGTLAFDKFLLNRFRRPVPRLALGAALIGLASACMDISDGLLIDADRLARASGVGLRIDLPAIPLSDAARAHDAHPMACATAGDDYELLFTAPARRAADVAALAARLRLPLARIGRIAPAATAGPGVAAFDAGGRDVTPARLGWEH